MCPEITDEGGTPGPKRLTFSNFVELSDRINDTGAQVSITAIRAYVENIGDNAVNAKAEVYSLSGTTMTKQYEGDVLSVPKSGAQWRDFPISFTWANGVTYWIGVFGAKGTYSGIPNSSVLYVYFIEVETKRETYKGAVYPTAPASFSTAGQQDTHNLNVAAVYEVAVLASKRLLVGVGI